VTARNAGDARFALPVESYALDGPWLWLRAGPGLAVACRRCCELGERPAPIRAHIDTRAWRHALVCATCGAWVWSGSRLVVFREGRLAN